MKNLTGTRLIQQLTAESMIAFLEMTSQERTEMIEGFYQLLPYQQTAIIQCKKRMTFNEKKLFKEIVEKDNKEEKSY